MKTERNEFLSLVCNLYMIVLLGVIPIYTGGTFEKLGDTKFFLFRNLSFLCVGISIVAGFVIAVSERYKRHKTSQMQDVYDSNKFSFSLMDICMLAYGGSVLLSAFFSSYGVAAWNGYQDWYMGTISQILFVCIYFLVSRLYDDSKYPICFGEATLFAVTMIAFANRLGVDPMGLYVDFTTKDWEYSHMLSTVGNINWLCGYLSIAVAFAISSYLGCLQGIRRVWLYVISLFGLILLCIQGSTAGWVLAAVGLGICFLGGLKDSQYFKKGLLLAAGTAFSLPTFAFCVSVRESMDAMPIDGNVYAMICRWEWWLAGIAFLLIYLLFQFASAKVQQAIVRILLLLLGVGVIATGVYYATLDYVKEAVWEGTWGSGRSILWGLAWKGFSEADLLHKVIGVGPDCFAHYIYSAFPGQTQVHTEGHWAGAVFANAHNEWLNHLVNIGVWGTVCYAGIFVTALRRYREILLGVFAITMYGVLSLVSFQQVISTPLLFLVLGICENRLRKIS